MPNFILNINLDNEKSVTCQPLPILEETKIPVSDTKMEMDFTKMIMQINKLEGRKNMWAQDGIRKEWSPRIKAFFNDIKIHPVIDEGSELNCIDSSIAAKCFIKYNPIKLNDAPSQVFSFEIVNRLNGLNPPCHYQVNYWGRYVGGWGS